MKRHPMIHRMTYTFCLMWVLFFISAIHAQAETGNIVSIDRSQPVVDMPLQAVLEDLHIENVQYQWYRDDEIIIDNNDSSYVPTEQDYEHWLKVEVVSDDKVIGSDKVYFSKLPVMYIDTADGDLITSKENYKDGSMYIQGNNEFASQYDGDIEIKGRGNSSWGYPQKPYKIKLGKSTDLFGFGKNKHWVLLSPFLDQSLMRNRIAYDLSGKLGLVQMQITWVDVVLNGQYAGNYGLCEHIRVGDSRIPIFNWDDEIEEVAKKVCKANADILTKNDQDAIEDLLEKDLRWITSGVFTYKGITYTISDYYQVNSDISGGYVFELSFEYDEVSKFTTSKGLKVMLNTPEYLYQNATMFSYVKNYWQQFEDSICSVDGYNDEGKHYQELADFDSMVEYWLTMEIMGNDDASYKSRFAYKDSNQLLTFGPAWDFDWGCGSVTIESGATGWKVSFGTLWKDFIDDPYFCVKAAEKYWSIRDYLEEFIRDDGMIDSYYEYLYESGHATDVKWPETKVYGYIRRGFDGDVNALKTYLTKRIAWLDEQFASSTDIVKNLYLTESTNPYSPSEELDISFLNTIDDTSENKLKADGILLNKYEDTVNVQVTANNKSTALLSAYVNGHKHSTLKVIDGKVSFDIDASFLNAEAKTLNVLSFIGKDANGEVTGTNFATISVLDAVQEYTISFESEGGSEIADITVEYRAKIPELPKPTRNGYAFTGWYVDNTCTVPYNPDIMITNNLTLYAGWAIKEYTVSWIDHDGTIIKEEKVAYGQNTAKPADPQRSGYTFTGWYMDAACTIPYIPDTMPAHDLTLYAGWAAKEYTARWINHDGTIIKEEKIAYGQNTTKPADPQRSGYTFTGWYMDAACTIPYIPDTMPAHDLTLYAGWAEKTIDWNPKEDNVDSDTANHAKDKKITIVLSGQYKKPIKNQTAVTVNRALVSSITLYTAKYRTAELSARVTGSEQPVKWSSSDPGVAMVSKNGKVTAKKAGTAYITAEVAGVTVWCKIVVKKAKITAKLKSKKISGKKIVLKTGKKYKLNTSVTPYGKISYKVKNKKILKISRKGKIVPLKKGTTSITISANGMKKRLRVKSV